MMQFNDFKHAYIAAAEFEKKERKPAIVTSVNSLEAVKTE
jgi:predicted DNA binding CopG/RHH family protein